MSIHVVNEDREYRAGKHATEFRRFLQAINQWALYARHAYEQLTTTAL